MRSLPAVPILLLALVMGVATACSSDRVTTRSTPAPAYDLHDTYTWASPTRLRSEIRGSFVNDEALEARVRETFGARLDACGLVPASRAGATLAIAAALAVRPEVEAVDPYYSNHVAVKYEIGSLIVEFREATGNRLVWRGRSEARLRTLARGVGVTAIRWVDAEEERQWPLERMLEEIVEESGLADSGLDPARGKRPLSREARRDLYRRLDAAFPEPKVEMEIEKKEP